MLRFMIQCELLTGKNKKMRFKYHNQCDRFRQTDQGEADWQEMMKNAKPVEQQAFEAVCDPDDMLDEGESLSDFLASSSDPDAGFYQSTIRNHRVLFLQVSGFEFIYTPAGGPLPEGMGRSRDPQGISLDR